MKSIHGALFLFSIYIHISIILTSEIDEQALESIIMRHLITSKYQPTVRPPPIITHDAANSSTHQAVNIKISIYIVTISSVSVSTNDFTMDIIIRQQWIDKRLIINYTYDSLSIGYLKHKLWTPDLYFRNAKKAETHDVTKPNLMIWLYPDGTLKFSQKLTVTMFCEMNLWNFPLDTQTCFMQLGSYGYPIEDLQFHWWKNQHNRAITITDPMHLNEFDTPTIKEFYCETYYELTGNFSCLQADFTLKRKFGFYLIYTYLPSIFIVSISWVAFFIDHRAVPARITLGLLALLALMTQSSSVVEKLPRVSYVKAIDIWMFTCLAFVISSLFEFAVVNCLSRTQDKNRFRNELRQVVKNELMVLTSTAIRRRHCSTEENINSLNSSHLASNFSEFNLSAMLEQDDLINCNNNNNNITSPTNTSAINSNHMKKSKCNKFTRVKARQVDYWFSIGFPIVFVIFNIVYWFTFNRS